MIEQQFTDFEISPLAIRNKEFPGFEQDYLVLDSLLRKYQPKSVLEIGTNRGTGTRIICNAVPDAKVYSLDLPFGMGDAPLYHEDKDYTGINCNLPFTQLRGDSRCFDYESYPCEAYFIDGGHFYENVWAETINATIQKPKIIIYHDADIPEVLQAIQDAMSKNYELYRVVNTRIAYLLRK